MAEGRLRDGEDQFGKYIEENTGRGWRKLRRIINDMEFRVYKSLTEDYITALDATGFLLRLNTMSDRLEYKSEPLTDIQESVMLNRLQDLDMLNVGRMRTAMHEMAARNKYHPVREYLDALPPWDGREHFAALMNKLEMSSPLAQVFWRKFLIGSIAKVLDGAQNFMLVLMSLQGRGKSHLARWVCPIDKLFFEGPINPDNKDSAVRLINYWFWEVAELDATTRRADVAALKFFVTQKVVTVRIPYGRYDISKPAAASFIGTINPDGTQFLVDTENRRFAIVHLDSVDFSYTKINRAQLWAELYHAYKNGEQYELTQHEREIQSEINSEHITESPLESILMANYELDSSKPERFIAAHELLENLESLGLRGDQFKNKMELGKAMTRHGIQRTRRIVGGKRQYVYEGVAFQGDKKIVVPGFD